MARKLGAAQSWAVLSRLIIDFCSDRISSTNWIAHSRRGYTVRQHLTNNGRAEERERVKECEREREGGGGSKLRVGLWTQGSLERWMDEHIRQ
jgi:hypothetical protein